MRSILKPDELYKDIRHNLWQGLSRARLSLWRLSRIARHAMLCYAMLCSALYSSSADNIRFDFVDQDETQILCIFSSYGPRVVDFCDLLLSPSPVVALKIKRNRPSGQLLVCCVPNPQFDSVIEKVWHKQVF
jgi:hypothetical protein